MRGKAHFKQALLEHLGITPAYAGKRNCGRQSRCSTSDHPRVCGEKLKFIATLFSMWGSPPRRRGKAQDLTDRQPVCWITPACAGKSTSGMLFLSCSWDHPRMCGEKITLLYALADKEGSPPHVRGKVDKSTYRNLQNRITPACAGKSLTATRAARSTGDHPRMCGEKPDCKAKRNPKKGSPPHVRGKVVEKKDGSKVYRITPACAGKS